MMNQPTSDITITRQETESILPILYKFNISSSTTDPDLQKQNGKKFRIWVHNKYINTTLNLSCAPIYGRKCVLLIWVGTYY